MKLCTWRNLLLIAGTLVSGGGYADSAAQVRSVYFGGGFGYNKVPDYTETKTELQFFAGYRMDNTYGLDPDYFDLAIEGGYMDTSDVDRDGLWLTPVLFTHVGPLTDLFVRAGGEVGNNNGFIYGGGVAYQIERNMEVRLEVVDHPEAQSVQLNVVYHPWRSGY